MVSRIKKTKQMMAIEEAHGQSIEDLILTALRESTRDQDAANSIGILPTTLSHWIARLSLTNEAEAARNKRLDNLSVA